VGVNDEGEAVLDFGACGTIKLFQAGELMTSRCSKAKTIAGTCVNKGGVNFDVGGRLCSKKIMPGTDTVEVNLPMDIALYRSGEPERTGSDAHHTSVEILPAQSPLQKRRRTYISVYYFPNQKISVVQVRDGAVSALPVLQEGTRKTRRKLGAPIPISQSEFIITEPGRLPGPDVAGVPQRVAVSAEEQIDPVLKRLEIQENPGKVFVVPPVTPGKGTEIAITDGASTAESETTAILDVGTTLINIGEESVGSVKVRSVNIGNDGGPALVISEITIPKSSDFSTAATDDCKSKPTNGCEFDIRFKPTVVGERHAELLIAYNSKKSPSRISLSGIGTGPTSTPPTIELKIDASAQSQPFPIQKVGTAATRGISIKNTGEATVKIDKISVEGNNRGAFISNNQCNEAIPPNGTCSIDVKFAPQTPDGFSANLSITAIEVNSIGPVPRTITLPPLELRGTGGVPVIKTNQPDLCFGKHKVVKESEPLERQTLTLTVSNSGTVPLTVNYVSVNNEDFRIVEETCKAGDVAANGGACRITVGFTPRKSHLREGVLTILHDDNKGNPTKIPLKGSGKARNPVRRFFQWIFNRPEDPCK